MVRDDEIETVEAIPPPLEIVRKPQVKRRTTGKFKTLIKAKGKPNGKAKLKAKPRKPRTVDPAKLDQFGFRKGSLKSRAAAMYAAKRGATLQEVKKALKSTQFNLLTELEGKGFKIKRQQISGMHDRPVTRFHIDS